VEKVVYTEKTPVVKNDRPNGKGEYLTFGGRNVSLQKRRSWTGRIQKTGRLGKDKSARSSERRLESSVRRYCNP